MLRTRDHGARMEARANRIDSAGLLELPSTMVIGGRLDAEVAATFADRVHTVNRPTEPTPPRTSTPTTSADRALAREPSSASRRRPTSGAGEAAGRVRPTGAVDVVPAGIDHLPEPPESDVGDRVVTVRPVGPRLHRVPRGGAGLVVARTRSD